MPFIKIDTQIIATERIASIDRQADINGQTGVEIFLHGIAESFRYTGQFAEIAYNALYNIFPTPPIILGSDAPICIADIEWVDLNANFNGQQGVEVRVSTDEPGISRQYTGTDASNAYDVLVEAMGFAVAVA